MTTSQEREPLDLDRIAREVCEAIGSNNGHGTVYAALREVRDLAGQYHCTADMGIVWPLADGTELAEIRARDAASYVPSGPERLALPPYVINALDRRALLAEVDRLTAELAAMREREQRLERTIRNALALLDNGRDPYSVRAELNRAGPAGEPAAEVPRCIYLDVLPDDDQHCDLRAGHEGLHSTPRSRAALAGEPA